ncbi:hypothetical protein Hanom_Chr06g00482091 [Helianthus anomalus]
MSFVLNVSKSCTFRPLCQTQLDFLVKSSHVQYIDWDYCVISPSLPYPPSPPPLPDCFP